MTRFVCSHAQKDELDELAFRWLMKSHLPLSYVNNHDLKSWLQTAHPGYYLPSVESLKTRLDDRIEKMSVNIKEKLKKMKSGTLSADAWSAGGHSYFGILLHFVTEEGDHVSLCLDALPKDDGQDAVALAKRITSVLTQWGLEEEVTLPLQQRRFDHTNPHAHSYILSHTLSPEFKFSSLIQRMSCQPLPGNWASNGFPV